MRTMIDSEFPVTAPFPCDIVLIYIPGGDAAHGWSDSEMDNQPERYRFPCWVRSDPQQANADTDAANCIAWLSSHHVPTGTCVVLDLEISIDSSYVNEFNLKLRAAGYKTTKYGSLDFIFDNPKTDGGTWVANPTGTPHMVTEGDTVATQYEFAGGYDLSEVFDQSALPLWDTKPVAKTGFPVPILNPYLLNVELSWQPVTRARSYHYQFVRLSDEHVIANGSTSANTAMVPNVPSGEKYAWRVAVHATGSTLASHWSAWTPVNL